MESVSEAEPRDQEEDGEGPVLSPSGMTYLTPVICGVAGCLTLRSHGVEDEAPFSGRETSAPLGPSQWENLLGPEQTAIGGLWETLYQYDAIHAPWPA